MSVTKQANGRWRARWRGPDKRERAQVFDTKADARAWEAEQRRLVRRGAWVDPAGGRVTVSEWAEQWVSMQTWRPLTHARVRSVLNRHLLPAFGDRSLASVRHADVAAWVAGLSRELKPSSVETTYNVLRQMMRAAVRHELVVVNPADAIGLPRQERRVVVPLEVEQVYALADAVRADLSAAVLLAASCGLRQGEVIGLTEDRVKWLKREIVVDRQMSTPPRGAAVLAPTKSRASNRVVPAPDSVLKVLSQHIEAFGLGSDGLIFHEAGMPWRRSRVVEEWRRTQIEAGFKARFHDLRHFCASSLISAGVSVKGVQTVLGHASATETLEVYAHLWPADHDRTRDAMAGALGRNADYTRTATAT